METAPRNCRFLSLVVVELVLNTVDTEIDQEWPQQAKPKKGQCMNFSQGHSAEQKFNVSFVLVFLRKKSTRIHTKMGEIHMNFSFWPFLWFGLPGRLLN